MRPLPILKSIALEVGDAMRAADLEPRVVDYPALELLVLASHSPARDGTSFCPLSDDPCDRMIELATIRFLAARPELCGGTAIPLAAE